MLVVETKRLNFAGMKSGKKIHKIYRLLHFIPMGRFLVKGKLQMEKNCQKNVSKNACLCKAPHFIPRERDSVFLSVFPHH